MQNLKKNNKGFTLVELIVVIAILGVLMAVLVPQYIQYVEKSKVATDTSAMSEVSHAIEIALADETIYNALPTADFTVAYRDSAAGFTLGSGAPAALSTELVKVVTLPVDFKSKTYNTQTATITVTYNATNKTYAVSAPVFAVTPAMP